MRFAGFGLVGLLVTVGLMMFFFYKVDAPEIQSGQKAMEQAAQIAGRDENRTPINQTYKLEAENQNGKLSDFLVVSVDAGSPMEKIFDLKAGDKIVGAIGRGGMLNDFRGNGDEEMCRDNIMEAYQFGGRLKVDRGSATVWQPGNIPANGNNPPPARTDDPMKQLQHELDAAGKN
jgi:hypothetical protein